MTSNHMTQREIKFRAWHKKKRAWKGLWIFRGGHKGEFDVSPKPDIFDLTDKWEGCVLMQFTGLKDKNGKEIYEGDIIKNEDTTYAVRWNTTEARWTGALKTANNIMGSFGLRTIMKSGDTEVIGNVMENPELLKNNG